MLQFGGFPLADASDTRTCQDVPFGDPGIVDSLRLPRAYRSLARPSSALEPSHSPDGLAAVERDGSGFLRGSRMQRLHRAARIPWVRGRLTLSAFMASDPEILATSL